MLNEILDMIFQDAVKNLPDSWDYRIQQNEVHVELSVRVKWGGGIYLSTQVIGI